MRWYVLARYQDPQLGGDGRWYPITVHAEKDRADMMAKSATSKEARFKVIPVEVAQAENPWVEKKE